ncbi:MAG: response regulator transcription factor [Pyrinomonadaceae bacterium]
MNKLRIFLADDHAIVREGLKALINAQPDMEVIGEAAEGHLALRGAMQLQPDVVVLDVSMPAPSGAEVAEKLKKARPAVRVLALTVHEDASYLRRLFEAGARGYVLKRAAADELIHALRRVAAGGTYIDPALAGKVVDRYLGRQPAGGAAQQGALSERETAVLRLIALGYSNKEIGTHLGVGVRSVETYKSRLMEKLDLRSRADIVRYALHQGWLRDDQ